MQILLVDDEKHMTKILSRYFEEAGFLVHVAHHADEAIELFYEHKIDICVTDWMMPGRSGVELCRELKSLRPVKVIVLTAKLENDDEFMALNAGADDYVRKPFDPRVLLARVKKLTQLEQQVQVADLVIDFKSQLVYKASERLKLTSKEYELLMFFYEHKNQILTRDSLLNRVWGLDYEGDARTVDTHIKRLRDKIGSELITTHRGMGYCFDV